MVALMFEPLDCLGRGLGFVFGIGPLELLIVALVGGMFVAGVVATIVVIIFAVKHANTAPPLKARENNRPTCEKPPVQKQ